MFIAQTSYAIRVWTNEWYWH